MRPALDGCVLVEKLDATVPPLPEGSPTEPSALRFTGVVGSFSSYALVTADSPYCDPNGDGQIDTNTIFMARNTPAPTTPPMPTAPSRSSMSPSAPSAAATPTAPRARRCAA